MEPGMVTVTDAQSILVLGTVIQNLFVTTTQQYSQFSVLMYKHRSPSNKLSFPKIPQSSIKDNYL